ncbi:MAG: hypothetical protein AAF721_37270, partial [Myxococcota bacterium]
MRSLPAYGEFDLDLPVVTVSRNAEFIVVRDGAKLKVVTHRGEPHATVDALFDRGDPMWARYGISPDGTLLAEADSARVRVVQLPEGNELWSETTHEIGDLWGPLVFSPDSTRLALPQQGHVAIVDSRRSTVVADIGAANDWVIDRGHGPRHNSAYGLVLTCRVDFSEDQERIAALCDSNERSPRNHTVFVASLAEPARVTELYGHADGVEGVAFGDGHEVVTNDGRGTLRWFDADGALLASVDAGRYFAGDLNVSPGEGSVSTFHRKYLGGTWSRASEKATAVPNRNRFVTVTPTGEAWSLSDQGAMTKPRVVAPRHVPLVTYSPATQRAQRAVWQIARGAYDVAATALQGTHDADKFVTAQQLVAFKRAGGEDFGAFLQRPDAPASAPAGAPALAADFVDGGFGDLAVEVFRAWLAIDGKATRPEDERARMLAVALELFDLRLSTLRTVELAKIVFDAWPNDAAALDAYATLTRLDDPELGLKTVQDFVHRNPQSVAAWRMLADIMVHTDRARFDEVLARAG